MTTRYSRAQRSALFKVIQENNAPHTGILLLLTNFLISLPALLKDLLVTSALLSPQALQRGLWKSSKRRHIQLWGRRRLHMLPTQTSSNRL